MVMFVAGLPLQIVGVWLLLGLGRSGGCQGVRG